MRRTSKRSRTNGTLSLERAPTHKILRTSVQTVALIATDQGQVYQVDPTGNGTDFADLANVFDQYRVKSVKLTWVLSRNDTAELPTLVYAPDFNDNTAPALQALLNYETARVVQFSEHKRQHAVTFVPKARVAITAAGAGGGTSDLAITGQTWCHTSQSAQWAGMKYFLVGYNSTANPTAIIQLYAQVTYEFKNSR